MSLKLITAPTLIPITLAEAKLHCKVDVTDDDALITSLISAATEAAEQVTGRALLPQTFELTLDAFPDYFELTRQPVTAITSIIYQNTAGALITLAGSAYTLDASNESGPAKVTPAYGTAWPEARADVAAVKLRYVAGYTNAAAVPESIKSWIKLQIAAMYENRSAEFTGQGFSSMKLGFVDALLDRHKVFA